MMNRILFFAILLLSLIGCNKKEAKPTEPVSEAVLVADTTTNAVAEMPKDEMTEAIANFDFGTIFGDIELVTMRVTKEDDKDPYKKYGFDTGGNCYDCDVATLTFTDTKGLIVSNACGGEDAIRYEIKSVRKNGNNIIVKTKETTFVFNKMKGAPVYALTVEGVVHQSEQLKLTPYYAPNNALYKFEINDCGEYAGN